MNSTSHWVDAYTIEQVMVIGDRRDLLELVDNTHGLGSALEYFDLLARHSLIGRWMYREDLNRVVDSAIYFDDLMARPIASAFAELALGAAKALAKISGYVRLVSEIRKEAIVPPFGIIKFWDNEDEHNIQQAIVQLKYSFGSIGARVVEWPVNGMRREMASWPVQGILRKKDLLPNLASAETIDRGPKFAIVEVLDRGLWLGNTGMATVAGRIRHLFPGQPNNPADENQLLGVPKLLPLPSGMLIACRFFEDPSPLDNIVPSLEISKIAAQYAKKRQRGR